MSIGDFLQAYAAPIGAVAAVLTIVALGLAIWQTFDLKSIRGSLPTRDIGAFPDYVGEITKLLCTAKERIVVACDSPCYCIFSNRQLWSDYKTALEHAKDNCIRNQKVPSLSLIWMDKQCRVAVLREQFKPNLAETATDEERNRWKNNHRDKLKFFLQAEGDPRDADSLPFEEFEKLVENAHERMISDLRAVGYTPVHRSLHLYFWIVDDTAIFAIPNYEDRGKGRGFWTRDKNIVNGLQIISERLKDTEIMEGVHE